MQGETNNYFLQLLEEVAVQVPIRKRESALSARGPLCSVKEA